MLYIWDVEKIIKDTLDEHQLSINYEFNNELAAPMSYNVSTNTIKFNYLQMNGYQAKVNFKLKETEENIALILLYHEIGYYLDFKKHRHDLRILMYEDEEVQQELLAEIEENAWEQGRKLVPDDLKESYDHLREIDQQFQNGR
ncbi:hypothetical protein [Pseudalkalibacillus hwajinpoensis]|uniref:hypothetical protein n=1 Tax=Guptibacillus hwajinpoensis TaxID=208199 RepID=UPI001CD71B35|nr:hypothetical protein [Pseudalkalibacillus hwajinpoensis]MCA0992077.1 hypothetical protein [Pseudalkalibacillus hwajinpoensis]